MSTSSFNEPNPALVFETLNAYQRTGALKAAIELRLFTMIGKNGRDVAELAGDCQADVRGLRILCDYLTVLGFLQKSDSSYRLTPTSAVFLDENSPAYMGCVAKFVASADIMDAHRDVAGAVRRGGTLLPEGGSTKVDYEPWVEFARSMAPMMKPAAIFIGDLVAARFSSRQIRVLDIAASHGLFGLAIAERLPDATIVAQDFKAVLAVAEENATATGVADRYSFLPGDVMTIDLKGPYDCILLTNFLHHFSVAKCESLLKKLQACLNPGGIVVTLEFIPNDDRISPPIPATFALTMLMTTDHGDAYTFRDYDEMFKAAGFVSELVEIPKSPSRLIVSATPRPR